MASLLDSVRNGDTRPRLASHPTARLTPCLCPTHRDRRRSHGVRQVHAGGGARRRWARLRSSTPTRCSSIAAWTSARPNPPPRSARHTASPLRHAGRDRGLLGRRVPELARAAIADCHQRGVTPIVVGGSALYVRAIVDRLDFPGTDPALRDRWKAELAPAGRRPCMPSCATRRRRGGPDPADQRPPHRPRPRGHRADREAVRGVDAGIRVGVRRPDDARPRRAAGRARRTPGRSGRAMWAYGFVDEVRALREIGLGGRADGEPAHSDRYFCRFISQREARTIPLG